MNRLKISIQGFLRDESGVLLAEALLLLPLLIWAFLALFVYWDLFRTMNVTQKAAYSIADLMSRQEVVTTGFVDGLEEVLDFLTAGAPTSEMRITSMEYNSTTNKYVLLFSRSTDAKYPPYNTAGLQTLNTPVKRIPTLDNLESVVIVETWVDYKPGFDTGVLNVATGVTDEIFTQFIVTKPRKRRVCLDGTSTCT